MPIRPRDFRIKLAEEEKNIGDSELSDILASKVRVYLLDPKRDKFPFPKGKPKSDIKRSGIAEERRGTLSYYTTTQIKEAIDKILSDSETIQSIDHAILQSEVFYRFMKYSFEVSLYQMKQDEKKFLNTMKAPIMKYGIKHKSLEELDRFDIFPKDLTPDKIKSLSKGYAINAISNFKQDGKNILYTIAGLFFLSNVYGSSQKGEKAEPNV